MRGPFVETDGAAEGRLIQVNATALVHLTRLWVPGMVTAQPVSLPECVEVSRRRARRKSGGSRRGWGEVQRRGDPGFERFLIAGLVPALVEQDLSLLVQS